MVNGMLNKKKFQTHSIERQVFEVTACTHTRLLACLALYSDLCQMVCAVGEMIEWISTFLLLSNAVLAVVVVVDAPAATEELHCRKQDVSPPLAWFLKYMIRWHKCEAILFTSCWRSPPSQFTRSECRNWFVQKDCRHAMVKFTDQFSAVYS